MRTSTRIAATVASAGLIAAAMAAPASAARPDWSKKSDSSIVETAIALSSLEGLDTDPGDFDILIKALLETKVVDIFNGTDYTVFAPTDQAFIVTADTLSEDKIVSEEDAWKFYEGLGLTAVAQVLAYHVTEGVRNSKSVTSTKQVTMLDGGTITARDGFVEAAKSDAKFVKGLINVRVSDGMIHVIDNVLLP
jgi:uncharacterized surface protein with fasciclin (FAS1) repeats